MGYRMSIEAESNREDFVGDDHKFYGYAKYDNVSSSFTYLFRRALCKQEEWKDYLLFETPERDAYDIFCCIPYTGDIVLSEDEFEVFTGLYLSDLQRTFPDRDISHIEKYMDDMCNTPGNKILYWG